MSPGTSRTGREQGCAPHDTTVRPDRRLPLRAGRRPRRCRRCFARRRAPQSRGRRHAAEDHRLGRQARARVRLVEDARAEPGPLHALHHVRLRRARGPDEGGRHPGLPRRRPDARMGRRGRLAAPRRGLRRLHAAPVRALPRPDHGLRGMERAQRGRLLEGRRLAGRLHPAAQGHALRRQERRPRRQGGGRRPDRQRLRSTSRSFTSRAPRAASTSSAFTPTAPATARTRARRRGTPTGGSPAGRSPGTARSTPRCWTTATTCRSG